MRTPRAWAFAFLTLAVGGLAVGTIAAAPLPPVATPLTVRVIDTTGALLGMTELPHPAQLEVRVTAATPIDYAAPAGQGMTTTRVLWSEGALAGVDLVLIVVRAVRPFSNATATIATASFARTITLAEPVQRLPVQDTMTRAAPPSTTRAHADSALAAMFPSPTAAPRVPSTSTVGDEQRNADWVNMAENLFTTDRPTSTTLPTTRPAPIVRQPPSVVPRIVQSTTVRSSGVQAPPAARPTMPLMPDSQAHVAGRYTMDQLFAPPGTQTTWNSAAVPPAPTLPAKVPAQPAPAGVAPTPAPLLPAAPSATAPNVPAKPAGGDPAGPSPGSTLPKTILALGADAPAGGGILMLERRVIPQLGLAVSAAMPFAPDSVRTADPARRSETHSISAVLRVYAVPSTTTPYLEGSLGQGWTQAGTAVAMSHVALGLVFDTRHALLDLALEAVRTDANHPATAAFRAMLAIPFRAGGP